MKTTIEQIFVEIDEFSIPKELDYSAMTNEELEFIIEMHRAGKLDNPEQFSDLEERKLVWIQEKYILKNPAEYDKNHVNPFEDEHH